MQMNASSIVNQKAEWEKLGVKLPAFDHAAMTAAIRAFRTSRAMPPRRWRCRSTTGRR